MRGAGGYQAGMFDALISGLDRRLGRRRSRSAPSACCSSTSACARASAAPAPAAAAVATADLLYAAVAAAAGTAAASLLEPHEHAHEADRRRRARRGGGAQPALAAPPDRRPRPAAVPPATHLYGRFLALTAINPTTVVYFVALIAGLPAVASAPALGQGWSSCVAVGVASLSWQLTLAGSGAALHHRLPEQRTALDRAGGQRARARTRAADGAQRLDAGAPAHGGGREAWRPSPGRPRCARARARARRRTSRRTPCRSPRAAARAPARGSTPGGRRGRRRARRRRRRRSARASRGPRQSPFRPRG